MVRKHNIMNKLCFYGKGGFTDDMGVLQVNNSCTYFIFVTLIVYMCDYSI